MTSKYREQADNLIQLWKCKGTEKYFREVEAQWSTDMACFDF